VVNTTAKTRKTQTKRRKALRLPVVSLGAEFLVQGFLMRRNILAFKSPPRNEGHDLICIHPNPRKATRQIRVQVKSRYATDSNKGFPLKEKTLDAFDYLILVCQNIGYFHGHRNVRDGQTAPVFYTLPVRVVRRLHRRKGKGWEIFRARRAELAPYEGEAALDQIAADLKVPYPSRKDLVARDKA